MLLSACTTQLPEPTSFPAPNTIVANNGNLATDLYAQFALAKVTGATDDQGTPIDEIWTRAYSTTPADPQNPLDELPGPTFVFHPGDWLQIKLHNQLNESANQELREAQDNIPTDSQDDIKGHIAHELNIPHNLNNTNLHVHGLHVDPIDDDSTLLILPEDDNPGTYPPDRAWCLTKTAGGNGSTAIGCPPTTCRGPIGIMLISTAPRRRTWKTVWQAHWSFALTSRVMISCQGFGMKIRT
jgi:hypothetical protein